MLRLQVLISCLTHLKTSLPLVIQDYGIQEKAWKDLTQPVPWMANERQHVKNTIETIMYGTLDAMSLPRYELPAEYIAATICCLVHPVNYQKACAFAENTYSAESISHENVTEREAVTPQRLFAMVCRVPQADLTGFQTEFHKRNEYNFERTSDINVETKSRKSA